MKIKTKLKACFVCILSVATGIYAGNAAKSGVYADNPQQITFTATVSESLSVSLNQGALVTSGAADSLLRNSFTITVSTNNNSGYTASMWSDTSTDLVNSVDTETTIATLQKSSPASSFPSNSWGYSLNDADYDPMTSNSSASIQINSSANAVSGAEKTVYFGAKIDASHVTGDYTNNVIIGVVGGVSSTGPNSPSQDPTDSGNLSNDATYVEAGSGSGNTVYHTVSGSTDTTQIISGQYTGPLGATESTYYTSSNVSGGSSLATGLAVASATAAVSGGLFFVLAKLRDRDDDEE